MKPYVFGAFVSLVAMIGAAYLDQPKGATFAQRWAPVDRVQPRSPYKGDKLKPTGALPTAAAPRANWRANPVLQYPII